MSYASVLVHVDHEAPLGGRCSIAAELADRFHALLIGVAAWAPMAVFPPAEEVSEKPAVGDFHLQDMKTLLDQKGKEFCAAFGTPDRRVEWRSILDFPTEAVARQARAADLVIIRGPAQSGRRWPTSIGRSSLMYQFTECTVEKYMTRSVMTVTRQATVYESMISILFQSSKMALRWEL